MGSGDLRDGRHAGPRRGRGGCMTARPLVALFLATVALSGRATEPPAASPSDAGHAATTAGNPAAAPDRSPGADPLALAIDAIVEREAVGPVAEPCNDAAFLRRVHLDLVGTIPAAERVRAFLADTAALKRVELVDELLASPGHARQMALVLDAMLLERKGAGAEAAAWRGYLATAVADDRPFDQVCAELIGTDGATPATRPAVTFQLVREVDPLRLTRSVGRLFLGRDLECCQCHDHPDNADLRQADYHGLRAFFQRSSLFNPAADQPALVGETADGEVEYTSVFTKESAKGVRPRLPAGLALVGEPLPEPGDDYVSAPAKGVRGVPAHSRREALSRMLVESAEFPRVLANRVWAMLFGRGLVHPLDGHDPDNPPVHPDLLELLAAHLRDGGYRLRGLVRGIVLSRTYQRSSAPLPLDDAARAALPSFIDRLAAEQTAAEGALPALAAARDAAATRAQALFAADAAARDAVAPLLEPRAKARVAADAASALAKNAADELTKKTAQGESLSQAATQAAAAAALLPDDKVLGGAAAIITARAAEFAPTLEVARGALAARTTEAEAATAALAAARRAVEEAAVARPPVVDLTQADREAVAARLAWQGARDRIARIGMRLVLARDMIRHGELMATDPAAAAALAGSIDERRMALVQVARLRPLSPEQLAFSILTATGRLATARAAAAAQLDKEPPAALQAALPDRQAAVRGLYEELGIVQQQAGFLGAVAGLYGDPLAGDFQASVNQALWLGNAPDLAGQLQPGGDGLVARLVALADDGVLADDVFLAVLSRPSDATDRADVAAALAGRADDRAAAIAEVVWATLASAEFRFNH
ncbi:MAG: DUF1549 domain-containing protein [Planctomycetia bacterium]|nr:DUF1549 domain-containing protein [Planctomycetia bacterium]